MNISFTSTKTTQSFFLNVKSNAVSLVVDEITVYTFDRAGRLVTAVIDDRTYRRGLDNRVLCKWREPEVTSWAGRRRWLSETESRRVIDHVHGDAQTALWALEQGACALRGDQAASTDIDAATRWLQRLVVFDVELLARDAERMSSVYRPVTILPPDQYLSLVLQATEGCSYNRCSFCSFYRERPFRIKSPAEFRAHILSVLDFLGEGVTLRRSVFLADANALCMPREQLLPLLELVNEMLPIRSATTAESGFCLEGINSFVDAFSDPLRTARDYAELKDYGVGRLYLGVETGSLELLRFLHKPQKPKDVRETVDAIKGGGLNVGVILMLGIGGDKYAAEHLEESISLLNSFPWSQGDLVFLSEFVEFPNLQYPELAAKAGIRALSPVEVEEQYHNLRDGIRRSGSVPKIAPYNAEEFTY
jgi:hypothetical protein